MFDLLLGTKFSRKCNHAIKRIATRIATIRRKKQAMLRFLRKDVADLIANGLEINAFGRIEALIVETNHVSCYDMIEHYCEYIKSQLPTLQKRECPNVNEVREAVATLIYAAARFSDLPELCDLRHTFTERYGSDMEASTSAEFVEKMQKKTFSINKKLRLMQDITQEFSVTWDFKAFEQKMSAPSASVLDQPKKGTPISTSNQINKPLPSSTTRKEAINVMPSEEISCKGKFEAALRRDQPRKGTTCNPLPAGNARMEADNGKFEATLGRDQHPRNGIPTHNEPLSVSNARREVDSDALIDKVPYNGKFEANARRDQPRKGTTCNPLPVGNARMEADKGKFEATLGRDQHPRNGIPTHNEPLPVSNARREADSDALIDKVPYKGKFETNARRDQPRKGTTCNPLPAGNAWMEADKGKLEATLRRDQHPRNGISTHNEPLPVSNARNGIPTHNEPLPVSNARREADSDALIDKVPYKGKFEVNVRSTSQKKIQPEPRVIHVVSSFSNGQTHDGSERTRKVITNETENVEPKSTNAAPPPYFKAKDKLKDVQSKESSACDRLPRGVVGIDRSASMVPPFTKPRFNVEEHHSNRFAYDGSRRAAEDPTDQERQPVTRVNSNGRPFNMIPPYVKPKANDLQADDCFSGGDLKDHSKDEIPQPKPGRRRQAKPQAFSEIETTTDDSRLVGRTPSGRRRHGGQPSHVIYDDDYNEGEKRRHREPNQAVWDDERHGGRRSRHGSRRHTDAIYDKYCDEEVVMDQLLMHYSTKGTDNKHGKTRTRTRAPPAEIVLEQQSDVKLYHRAASSPIKPIRLAEVFEGPAPSALRGA